MAVTETTANSALAVLLRRLHPRWVVRSEESGRVLGAPGHRPDITIDVARAAPVVIETEFEPARTVESDALGRLGITLVDDPLPVETVVAVRIPKRLRNLSSNQVLDARLAAADDLSWALYTERAPQRRPARGWITGTAADLASTLETLLVSPRRLDEAADTLQRATVTASGLLDQLNDSVQQRIGDAMHQEPGEQTWKMAASVITNAFLFQEAIAGHHDTPNLSETRQRSTGGLRLSRWSVQSAWNEILGVNYLPVFDVALQVIISLPAGDAEVLCDELARAASELEFAGLNQVQDMTGQLFGRLIADRKFLATFYTLPSAAALLAELALSHLEVDWSDTSQISALRIADFACGTGALLSAAYRRIGARLRRAGGDDAAVHREMIEDALIGADIMPAAAHLTTTMLASVHPQIGFGHCGVHYVDYGRPEPGEPLAIGSLELLGERGAVGSSWAAMRPVQRTSGTAATAVPQMALDDGSLDLCIMNPPFTRPTNHEATDVPVPSFAGLGTDEQHQAEMSERLASINSRLGKPRAGHGNAGLASNFVDLAYAKTRPGGVMAFVLPFSIIAGASWSGARDLLERYCDDVTVATLAAHGSTERAFSADTHMAEALVIARKAPIRKASNPAPVNWVSLRERPPTETESVWAADAITEAQARSDTERIRVGSDTIGHVIRGSMSDGSRYSAIAEPDLALFAAAMARGRLELPRHTTVPLPTCDLGELGEPGPVDRDINGADRRTGVPRGPFDLELLTSAGAVSYPILWAHAASSGRESALEVAPDRFGRMRHGMRELALQV